MNLSDDAKKKIKLIHKRCIDSGLTSSSISQKEYNFEFTVQDLKDKIKVQVYFGKKGIKTIIQGNLNSKLYRTINDLILDEPKLNLEDPDFIEPDEYIGTDECGKGDFFGPLVVAAVFVNKETKIKFKKIGVRDSKDLNENQITQISKLIREIVPANMIEIVSISPEKYNQLYDKFNNLNKLLNWAHSKAISNLIHVTNSIKVITDKFSRSDLNIMNDINHSHVDFVQLHGAEKYIGVAAASIVARDTFNKWFKQKDKIGIHLAKGSSDLVENSARELFIKLGEEKFSHLAKLHFKTFKKIKS